MPDVIYTEVTKETSPIGGIWSAEPFAMRHVEWVPLADYEAIRADRDALAGKAREMIRINFMRHGIPVDERQIEAAFNRCWQR